MSRRVTFSINENQNTINRKNTMFQKGHSLESLAEHVHHSKQAVSQAILGKSTSLRIHRKIADVLDVALVDFWPELYGETDKHSTPPAEFEKNLNETRA